MSIITTKFDNQLKQSTIEVPLIAPREEEMEIDNKTATSQTLIHGVWTPIVAINDIVFDFDKVLRMNLYDDDRLPRIEVTIFDENKLLSGINNPSNDNELRLQILPPFEDAYKKINLTFYITNISIKGNRVNISAIYKLPDLYISRLNSFGQLNTYDLFEKISSECKLGFASNCETNDLDKRYIYCDNISYEELMNREIKTSGSQTIVYDYWVDLWNNVNFVDIYERVNAKDKEEEMEVWSLNTDGIIVDSDVHIKPEKIDAIITNHPAVRNELSAYSYKINNDLGLNCLKGTDRVFSIYKNGSVIDSIIEDGNVKNDIFTKYYYLGENIGEFEYLTAASFRDSFMDTIKKNSIEVNLSRPQFGLTRGSHVKFHWYENEEIQKYEIERLGGDMNSNEVDQEEEMVDENKLILNKQVSGEYMVYKSVIRYNHKKWDIVLTLVKPEDQIKTYMPK